MGQSPSDRLTWAIVHVLPWVLSVLTIYTAFMAGNHRASGWFVGAVNEALWFIYILVTEQWGLLPMNLALFGLYNRNYFKWRRGGLT